MGINAGSLVFIVAFNLAVASVSFADQSSSQYGAYVAPTKYSESCEDRVVRGKDVSYVWRFGVCIPKFLLKTPEKFSVIHKIIGEISPAGNKEIIHDFKFLYPPSEDYVHPKFMKDAFTTEVVDIFGKKIKLRDGSTFEVEAGYQYGSTLSGNEVLAFETLDGWYLCFKGERHEAKVVGRLSSSNLFRDEIRYPSWSKLVSRPICGG